jgi:hypothetical protein
VSFGHFLPSDDSFTDDTPDYGYSPVRYMRINAWNDTTIGDTTANAITGYVHDGYIATPSSGGKAAAAEDASGVARHTVTFVERTQYIADATAYINPYTVIKSGDWHDTSHRCVCVLGRMSGGTVMDANTRDEYIDAPDGYAFLYHHRPVANWWSYTLIRINNGSATRLAFVDVGENVFPNNPPGNNTPNHASHPDSNDAPTRMWMKITGTGPTVTIDCYRRRKGFGAEGFEDELLFTYEDKDASRITAAGRWGFGIQSAGIDTGNAEVYGAIDEFALDDAATDPTLLYCDRFERRSGLMGRETTTSPSTGTASRCSAREPL